MDTETNREVLLLNAALQLEPEKRGLYLDQACGQDLDLRRRVEDLLTAHDAAGSFLMSTIDGALPLSPFAAESSAAEKPGDTIGRYKLLQQIGEGGCGVVFMAEQLEPVRRRVALKVIKLGMDTKQVIARFEAERQALALMDHPNIARVLDGGCTDQGRPFFVMELVRGVKITEYCDRERRSTTDRLTLFIQVCHAIQHAHQKGIIHRDIKPSNILVTLHDGIPVPKVIDFGIAKATAGPLIEKTLFTSFERFLGTPAYMSPEQAEMSGLDMDTRSDVYSLGVLLYELLTGRTPFDGRDLLSRGIDEMRRILREEDPPQPSVRFQSLDSHERTTTAELRQIQHPELTHLLRGDLDWIVMKCLEKDRKRRYETTHDLALDIARHIQHEPVSARPAGLLYRAQKFARRHRTAFVSGAAILAVLIMGLGTSSWMYFRERAARLRANNAEHEQSRLRHRAEARGLITEARLLFHNGSRDAAQPLLDAAKRQIDTMDPDTAALIYSMLGEIHAGDGQWTHAARYFGAVADAQPADFDTYHQLLPVTHASGNAKTFDQRRSEALSRFAATTDPRVAERLIKDCLFVPWPTQDLTALVPAASLALHYESNHWAAPYFYVSKSLLELRRGNFTNALAWSDRSFESRRDNFRLTQAYMIRVMVLQHLGRTNDARDTLLTGIELAHQTINVPTANKTDWIDHIIASTLMGEARTLVLGDVPDSHIQELYFQQNLRYFRNLLPLGNIQAFNNLAWLLATCPIQRLRNGSEALDLATHAVQWTSRKDTAALEALAAAHAEMGQFANAVRIQSEACQLMPPGEARAPLDARLKLYQDQRPYRLD